MRALLGEEIKDDAVSIQVLKMKVKGESFLPFVRVEKNGLILKRVANEFCARLSKSFNRKSNQ